MSAREIAAWHVKYGRPFLRPMVGHGDMGGLNAACRKIGLLHLRFALTVIALGSGGKVRAEAKALLKKLEARNADQA